MKYIIYCDESEDKGRFYSNFYGGALVEANRREGLEAVLRNAKGQLKGELKWTKIGPYNEADYIRFVDAVFELVRGGFLKLRIMFTQNINVIPKAAEIDHENSYFKLYYQFVKHAFGLRFCNPGAKQNVSVSVYLDDAPDTAEKLESFKIYISTLSDYPVFTRARVRIAKSDVTEVNSKDHIILQAVDVILGAMQFRLNEHHKELAPGKKRRGKRTRSKERVYKHINKRIQEIYPRFNIGVSTGQAEGREVRWRHPYRHWCFVPKKSVQDLGRGKRKKV